MQRLKLALFLTATGVIGLSPVVFAAVYAARRRLERRGDEARVSRSSMRVFAALAGALIVVGGVFAWTFAEPKAPPASSHAGDGMGAVMDGARLPMQLAGQPLSSYLDGAEAIAAVRQLHAADFPLTDAEVATYGDGIATVWRSSAPDATTAADQVERMRDRIASGSSPFAVPHLTRRHPDVYATRGIGLRHFFFARGASVWWVAAAPDVARRALAETLEAAA